MSMKGVHLATICLVAMACRAVDDSEPQKEFVDEDAPDIEVDPGSIDFGELDASTGAIEEQTRTIGYRNVGTADLHLYSAEPASDESPFVVTSITPLVLAGETGAIVVSWLPEAGGEFSDVILLNSDDPDEPTIEIPVLGTCLSPVLDLSPSGIDFGSVIIGCEPTDVITLSNVGNVDLVVSGVDLDASAMQDLTFDDGTASTGELPWTLTPGASAELRFDFAPIDERAQLATLLITSNDPFEPEQTSRIEGNGALSGSTVDTFEQPLKNVADIVFAVDRSDSMDDELIGFVDSFPAFFAQLEALGNDYRVAITVEDDGCINGSDLFIDEDFSDTQAAIAVASMTNVGGAYGSNTSAGFMLLDAFLAESFGGCNERFVRDAASLHVVGVSDGPDESVESYNYYVSLFHSLKAEPELLTVHAIGGDSPDGCDTAAAYDGFYEATELTGGTFLSICTTDWDATMVELAEHTTSRHSSFALSTEPVPGTIEVRIDGLRERTGWDYDEASNRVRFDDDRVPEGGATIEVQYALFGECED